MSAPLHPAHLLAIGARRTFASLLGLLRSCLLFASASVRAAAIKYAYDANERLIGLSHSHLARWGKTSFT